MTKPPEFALLHYGNDTVMMLNCILNLVMNLHISYMVFVSYIQKPSIAPQSQRPRFFFQVLLSRSSSHMHIDECPHQLSFRGKKNKLHMVAPIFISKYRSGCGGWEGKLIVL